MKHLATLLIQNVRYIYTMEKDAAGNDILLKDACIAIYHDRIIYAGSEGSSSYIDSATRIINGRGCIAVPGIIDCYFSAKPLLTPYLFEQSADPEAYYECHPQELQRDMLSLMYQMLQHGITTFAYANINPVYEQMLTSLSRHPYEYMSAPQKPDGDILTCRYDCREYPCIDPFYQMRRLLQNHTLAESEILKRFTQYPAAFLNCPHIGTISVGKQADILLLEGSSLEYVLHQILPVRLRSVIKRGTQQFPCILI